MGSRFSSLLFTMIAGSTAFAENCSLWLATALRAANVPDRVRAIVPRYWETATVNQIAEGLIQGGEFCIDKPFRLCLTSRVTSEKLTVWIYTLAAPRFAKWMGVRIGRSQGFNSVLPMALTGVLKGIDRTVRGHADLRSVEVIAPSVMNRRLGLS